MNAHLQPSGSAYFIDNAKPLVEAHARFLVQNPQMKMLIQGNTDERGSREYNIGLGQRRSDGLA